MSDRVAVVVTSISRPNEALGVIARGCGERGWDFLVVGDRKSPPDFALDHCRFLSMETQLATGLSTAAACPPNHYARKNVGYLVAIGAGASVIVETDDDNIPVDGFWAARPRSVAVPRITSAGWVNAYRYFTEATVWPRGLPLDAIHLDPPPFGDSIEVDCPIQQGLADGNPDVDAVFRLAFPEAPIFRRDRRIALGHGTWCPFNSQNTRWWRDAFAMLYLPAYCSFRMTDIWRSFVTQRIAWENGWSVLFHEATVRQDRNVHDLMRDFADEVPGYLNNRRIVERLASLPLRPGKDAIPDNMRACYRALVDMQLIGGNETALLEAWFSDLSGAGLHA